MKKKLKIKLLKLAREAIINPKKKFQTTKENELNKKQGAFVTLTKNDKLRGCIGYILPIESIHNTIIHCARAAAYEDTRFSPVTEDEIKDIKIEVSILSIPNKLEFKNVDDLLSKLTNEMGIILKKDFHQSTFLPQVWVQLPDKKDFLKHLSLKAGLAKDAWKDSDTAIEFYTVEKIEEE